MASLPAPVGVVSAMSDGIASAATVTAFCSLSAEPPMLLVSLHRDSATLRRIFDSYVFGLNLLSTEQESLARKLASHDPHKVADVDWVDDEGVPRLAGAPGWVRCAVSSIIDAGDHSVVIGNVLDAFDDPADRLLYYRRGYGRVVRLDEPSA